MRIAYFDCTSGISGDMTLGALVDAGVELAAIQAGIDSLGLPDCRLRAEEVKRQGFRATHIHVEHEPEHAHRHLHHITDMIDQSELSSAQQELARRIFTRLGEAEAKVHGTTLRKVHFHEVGAVDSIADIVGSAIGPLVGGALLEFFWWGSVFLLGVPVMVLLLVCGPLLLPEFRDEQAGRQDWPSALLSVAMVLAVIYGLKDMARNGVALMPILSIVLGLAIGVLFVQRQRRLAEPMFDMSLFAIRTFSTSVGAMMLTVLALSGAWLMVFQYLQGVLGLSPLEAGLVMLPPAVIQTVASLLVPKLTGWMPRWKLVSTGLLLAVIGLLMLVPVHSTDQIPLLIAGMTVMGAGVMPMMILGTDMVISAAPARKSGAASATSETATELGMALGIAVIGSIGAAVYRRHMLAAMPDSLPADLSLAAGDTLGGALGAAAQLPADIGEQVMAAAREGFSMALHTNAIIGALILAGTAALVALLLSRPDDKGDEEGDEACDTPLAISPNQQ